MTDELNRQFLKKFAAQETQDISKLAGAGKLISANQMAEMLGVTIASISEAARDNRLFFIQGADRELLYPAFYATARIERDQLSAICTALGSLPGTSKWQFFTTPRLSLGMRTAVRALEIGKFAKVLAAAKAFRGE